MQIDLWLQKPDKTIQLVGVITVHFDGRSSFIHTSLGNFNIDFMRSSPTSCLSCRLVSPVMCCSLGKNLIALYGHICNANKHGSLLSIKINSSKHWSDIQISIQMAKFTERTLTQRNLQVHSIPLSVHVKTDHRMYVVMLEHSQLILQYSDWGKNYCQCVLSIAAHKGVK